MRRGRRGGRARLVVHLHRAGPGPAAPRAGFRGEQGRRRRRSCATASPGGCGTWSRPRLAELPRRSPARRPGAPACGRGDVRRARRRPRRRPARRPCASRTTAAMTATVDGRAPSARPRSPVSLCAATRCWISPGLPPTLPLLPVLQRRTRSRRCRSTACCAGPGLRRVAVVALRAVAPWRCDEVPPRRARPYRRRRLARRHPYAGRGPPRGASAVLNFIYYPVSVILWFWHKVFGLPARRGRAAASPGRWRWSSSSSRSARSCTSRSWPGALDAQDAGVPAGDRRSSGKKYANDKQKHAAEMQRLQKEHGVNPLGGCLPVLVQVPVFIGLFHVLREFKPGVNGAVDRELLLRRGGRRVVQRRQPLRRQARRRG